MLAWLPLVAALRFGAGDPITPIVAASDDSGSASVSDGPIVSHPYLRTTVETALLLAAGEIWYLRHGTSGSWGRGISLGTWMRKANGQDIVFDGDHFKTNGIGHPLGGAAYYQIARGNGLGPGTAFISSVLASTVWEYFGEIPERTSLNDLILTPTAGSVIGEASYQLGRYIARSGAGPLGCAGALLFAPVATLNEWPRCNSRADSLPWAQVGLSAGVGRAVFDGGVAEDELALAFGAEIVSQPAYQRPGRGSVFVTPGQFSGLYANGRFGDRRVEGAWFNAHTVWAGRYDRNYRSIKNEMDVSGAGPPHGWGLLLGIGSSFDYRFRDLPADHDRIASVGLGGPTLEFSARHGVRVRVSLSLQYAFALVGSLAYRQSQLSLVGQPIGQSLRDGAYYYAQGVVSAATVTVGLGPLDLNADVRSAWYWSLDPGDVAQSTGERQVSLRDTRLFLSAGLWSRPVLGAVRIGFGVERIRRTSYMFESAVVGTETDVLAATAVGF